MEMENQWLAYAKRLQALASTSLYFCKDEFDRERFTEIADIANSMLAQLGNVPVERITNLVSDFAKGYSTPKVDVRGAIIEGDKILLVREKSDGKWTLPGGFADVGLSPAENVVKEIHEEAGLVVAATKLFNVRHKAKGPYDPDARDFYKLYFLCECSDTTSPFTGPETSGVDFFSLDNLPELSLGRVVKAHLETAFAFHRGMVTSTLFD